MVPTSIAEKALGFLVAFEEVSRILEGNDEFSTKPPPLLKVDERIGYVNMAGDDMFIKIVVSLQMNTEDPGLRTLEEMSYLAAEGRSFDDIMSRVDKADLVRVLGLCTDVMKGVRYVLRNDDKKASSDPMSVALSFIRSLEYLK